MFGCMLHATIFDVLSTFVFFVNFMCAPRQFSLTQASSHHLVIEAVFVLSNHALPSLVLWLQVKCCRLMACYFTLVGSVAAVTQPELYLRFGNK